MPSRLGHGLYKKNDHMKIFFVVYSTTIVGVQKKNIMVISYQHFVDSHMTRSDCNGDNPC